MSWVRSPIGAEARRWSTLPDTHKVLFLVNTVTSANRLLDLVPLFDSDLRVQLVFTCPDASAITGGVRECFAELGVLEVPWEQALGTAFALAITANHSGDLHQLQAPIMIVSHGVGYSKNVDGKHTYGLSEPSLLRDGRVVARALVLSHTEQLDRLAVAVPQAVPVAVVAGDPTLDRIRASRPLRSRYRATLGVKANQRLVVVSSTWSSRSLFGAWPDLFRQLLAELPVDSYRVAAILHPHVWFGHGPHQVRLWLADCLRAGLTLVPPLEGWGAALIAADMVIGDIGATTAYGSALDLPVVLAAFPEDDVASGSCVDALGTSAARLDPNRSLRAQVEEALSGFVPGELHKAADLISSYPDEAAARLRACAYGLLGLSEPKRGVQVPPLRLQPSTKDEMTAHLVTADLTRYPADVFPGRLLAEPVLDDPHLVVHADHPDRALRSAADIVFCHDEAQAETLFDDLPCRLVAVIDRDHCEVRLRDGQVFSYEGEDPLRYASELYLSLTTPGRAPG
ncbi:hypothetical protein NLX83_28785 [Allokutzneria sp. A3M-2-11 16]|uniref:hypothetical protein n=1 Tax=Allokutzneria sp. A3M-2-11 16 TaxID=2962043 RepID=UPI0020B76953|nr:hypothetical protein [Allokutzneria sp. A3M-2-11 16]MCP3803281.1 hypothetical protein [Allokutzneria sp. A3M-2-11 16]